MVMTNVRIYFSRNKLLKYFLIFASVAVSAQATTVENNYKCHISGDNVPIPLVRDKKAAINIHSAILKSIYPNMLSAKNVQTIAQDEGALWHVGQEMVFRDKNNKVISRSGPGISIKIDKCNGAIVRPC